MPEIVRNRWNGYTYLFGGDSASCCSRSTTSRRSMRPTPWPRPSSAAMRIDAPLDDQDEIDAMTLFLRDVARARGAEYDGWGTAIPR
jgi:hypothetical protein